VDEADLSETFPVPTKIRAAPAAREAVIGSPRNSAPHRTPKVASNARVPGLGLNPPGDHDHPSQTQGQTEGFLKGETFPEETGPGHGTEGRAESVENHLHRGQHPHEKETPAPKGGQKQ